MKGCPLCGGKAELFGSDLKETFFKVGCDYCEIYVIARNGIIAQSVWNAIGKVEQ